MKNKITIALALLATLLVIGIVGTIENGANLSAAAGTIPALAFLYWCSGRISD